MKKIVKIKALKESLTTLVETSIKVGDQTSAAKLRKRLVDLDRVGKAARAAAKKAEAQNKIDLADKLNKKADEIDELLKTYNIDTIDQEDSEKASENSNQVDEIEDTETELEGEEESDQEDEELEDEESEYSDTDETSSDENESNSAEENEIEQEEESSTDAEADQENSSSENTDTDVEDAENDSTNSTTENNSDIESADTEEESNSNDEESSDGSSNDSQQSDDDSQQNSNNNEENSEASQSDTENVEDPFADEDDIPNGLVSGNMDGQSRKATLDDIIKQLKGLSKEGKTGAIDALKSLLNSKEDTNESLITILHEAKKGVRDMTDDEFGDYINSIYDLIDEVEELTYVDDLADRKAKIKDWSNNPLTAQELNAEDNVELQKEIQAKKAREKEINKYRNFKSLDDLKLNLYNAVKFQVDIIRKEYQSYDEINPEYESEDIVMRADIVKDLPDEAIPIIDVYFDVSGSWTNDHIEVGKRAVASIKEFEDKGEIKINLFYFANTIGTTIEEAQSRGLGTRAWRQILQNIKRTRASNVLIMTDGDMDDWGDEGAKGGPTCRVDGCVWFLWRDGVNAPECVKHLIGRQGNYQYSFNTY